MAPSGPKDRDGRTYDRKGDGRVKYDGNTRHYEKGGRRYAETISPYGFNTTRDVGPARGDDRSGGGGGGPCYITTACVQAMGLADNCFELAVLRHFRDNVLMRTREGREAVHEYYAAAPAIIQAVEEREGNNALQVWRRVHADVRRAVQLVLSGDFEEATQHYREVTLRLRREYLR